MAPRSRRQESTLFLIRPSPLLRAYTYVNYPFPPSFLVPCLRDTVYRISFSIFRSILEYSRVRSQICGNAHTHTYTYVREKKRYTWSADVSIKSTRQSSNFLTLKVKSRIFPLCLLPRDFSPISFSRSYALLVPSQDASKCVLCNSRLFSSFAVAKEKYFAIPSLAVPPLRPRNPYFSVSHRGERFHAHTHTHTGAKRFVCSSVQSVGQTSRTLMA